MDIETLRTNERKEQLTQTPMPFEVAIHVTDKGNSYALQGKVTERGMRGKGYHVELMSDSQKTVGMSGLFFDDWGTFINLDGYQRYFELVANT
jgi:hypothetical protein